MRAFKVVEDFEAAIAAFSGAPYCVAVASGTWALFLSMQLVRQPHYDIARGWSTNEITMPARTFISVPMAAAHAGFIPKFRDGGFEGVYNLDPFDITDGALRFSRGMYHGGLHCLSFQARKILNIGEGGAILCDNAEDAAWLKAARYWGRDARDGFAVEKIKFMGWQAYMTPEKAARGLHLMEYIGDGEPDMVCSYPDLRDCGIF